MIPLIDDIDDVVDDIKKVNLISDLDDSITAITETLNDIKQNISSVTMNVNNFIFAAITDLAAISKLIEEDLGLVPPAIATVLEEITFLYNQIRAILGQIQLSLPDVQQIISNILNVTNKLNNVLCPALRALAIKPRIKSAVLLLCGKAQKNNRQVVSNFESFGISVANIRNYVSGNDFNINEFRVITNASSNIPEDDKQELLSKIQEIEDDNNFIRLNINVLDIQNIIQIISKFLNIRNTGLSILDIIAGLENLTETEESQLTSKVSTINLNSNSSNYIMQYLGSVFNENDEELTDFLNNLQGDSNIQLNNTGTGTNTTNSINENNNQNVSSLERRKRTRRRKRQKCHQNDVSNCFSDALKCIRE